MSVWFNNVTIFCVVALAIFTLAAVLTIGFVVVRPVRPGQAAVRTGRRMRQNRPAEG